MYYYRVALQDRATPSLYIYSDIVTHEPVHPRAYVGRYMALEKKVALERLVGAECYLYIRKTHGARCECWDEQRQKAIYEHCDLCYGTGFANGGFYAPIKILVQFEPSAVSPSMDVVGKSDNLETSGWTLGYPYISSGDVIVRAKKNELRYRVGNISFVEEFDVRISQILQLTQYPASSAMMRLPIAASIPSIDDVNVFMRSF